MKLEAVPLQFVLILKGTLAKMAGQGIVPNEFVDVDFWTKFQGRFNNRKSRVIKKII